MKTRILLLFALLLTVCGAGRAQTAGVPLGYCDGHYVTSGGLSVATAKADVSAAIYIPASTLKTFGGNHIDAIRVGLGTKLNISNLRVWVREELDGENLAEGTAEAVVKGQNDVTLATPYNLSSTDAKGLYFGYTFYQGSASKAVAYVHQGTPNAMFVQLPEQEWTDMSADGTLCLEALVYGDQLPVANLSITGVQATSAYVADRGVLAYDVTVKNLAPTTATSFDIITRVDGVDETFTTHISEPIDYKGEQTFGVELNVPAPAVTDNQGKFTVTIANIAEGDDADATDNVAEAVFSFVEHDFERMVLIEEFTTESCVNCPRVAGWLHNILESSEVEGHAVAICHHSGYFTDWLSLPSDADYLWFFNGPSTYAPALMVNRATENGGSESTPILGDVMGSENDIKGEVMKAMRKQAFVSVAPTATIDEENPALLHVTVSGAKSVDELCDNPVINVFLVENNIKARSQAGAGSDYMQQHVTRAVNTTWGVPVEFNGNDYEYTCDFTLGQEWKREDLQLVAFIYNYDSKDPTNCEVQNAGQKLIGNLFDATAIGGVSAQQAKVDAQWYTLGGVRVSSGSLLPGCYVVKQNGKTRKVVVK